MPANDKNKRTSKEEKEFQEGLKNPNGFRSEIFGDSKEISAFEKGQKEGRLKNGNEVKEDNNGQDDLESKR